jgi:DNA modification methylase
MVNKLILGDNLEILKTFESESVDLIYLDPPFFSNSNYEVIWGDDGEIRSFQDRWAGGMEHYIAWLKERVEQMHRILKPTGSIFLHCDWHADAYIRTMILDKIFGENNFRNHIIWKRTNTPKGSQFDNKQFGVVADSIFFYSKSQKYFFDDKKIRNKIIEEQINEKYPKEDEKGKYYEYPILRSASKGARPNLVYEYKGFTPPFYGWVVTKEKLVEIDNRGDLGWRTNGQPFRKFRPSEDPGILVNNIWDDILRIQSNSKEAIGYPTQKPEALLQRIIECASNEDDVILDPFVGGGTTVAVADRLNRYWIGIDQSVQAVKVTELRLDKQRELFSRPFTVQLHKYDHDELFTQNPFEFETFIIQQFDGTPQ